MNGFAGLVAAALRHDIWRARGVLRRLTLHLPASKKPLARLRIAPPDIRYADRATGDDIASGYFLLAGKAATLPANVSPFNREDVNPDWETALHGFGWLRHLRAVQGELADAQAVRLIRLWLDDQTRHGPAAWTVETTARRVIAWLSHAPFLLDAMSPEDNARFMRSLYLQASLLNYSRLSGPGGHPRLLAAIAVAMVRICLGDNSPAIDKAGKRLGREIDKQIFSDGGHVSRDPSVVVDLLLDLLPLRQTYLATSFEPPLQLMNAIERMMPMVRFFRHRDGTLARLNGTGASSTAEIATLLAYDDARGEPLRSAPHSGFERLTGLGATVIFDTGKPPPPWLAGRAHAGAAAFEMSTHSGHMIINCGASRKTASNWAQICRVTAAHSTVTVNETSCARFLPEGWLARRLGRALVDGPRKVQAERLDSKASQELIARHDGYAARFGVRHERRLLLSDDGTRLDGEDALMLDASAEVPQGGNSFAVRFHLHPSVELTTAEEGGLQLRLGNKEVWGVYADGANVSLEESVFVNGPEAPRKTRQIVLSGRFGADHRVYWSFIRSDHRPSETLQAEEAEDTSENESGAADEPSPTVEQREPDAPATQPPPEQPAEETAETDTPDAEPAPRNPGAPQP
ncbi:heparinase II/III family protein [Tepidamorphus sp. 3E244]|uniref:heparinase II/III family protein n=1 Tax=Tepidamorphus sp. 3E244 TaxID=3385498 RepID=UPI0038FCC460